MPCGYSKYFAKGPSIKYVFQKHCHEPFDMFSSLISLFCTVVKGQILQLVSRL